MNESTMHATHSSLPQNAALWLCIAGALLIGLFLVGCTDSGAEHAALPTLVPDAETRLVTIPVEGMSCAACVAGVRKSLEAMDGVAGAEVSLEHRQARVRYDAAQISPDELAAAISEMGYRAGAPVAEPATDAEIQE